jgi:hypothetical protein
VDIRLDADPLYTNNIRRGHHRGAFGRVVGDPEVESGLEKRCYLVFGREGAEKLARINPQLAPRSTTRQLRTAPSRTRTPFASPRFAGAAPVGRANTARLVRGRALIGEDADITRNLSYKTAIVRARHSFIA